MSVPVCPSWCRVVDLDSVHTHGPVTVLRTAAGVTVEVGSLVVGGTGYVQIRTGTGRPDLGGQDLALTQAWALIEALAAAHAVSHYPAAAMLCDIHGDAGHTVCVHWVPVSAPGLPQWMPRVRVERPRRRWARPRVGVTVDDTHVLYWLTRAETSQFIDALVDACDDAEQRAFGGAA